MLHRWLEYLKYRLWAAQQYPDMDLVYRQGGFTDLVRYLKRCGSPDITKDVLQRYGARIHPEAKPMGPWLTIHEAMDSFSNLEVGRSAHVGKEVFLDLSDRIVIEESVTVGMRAIILTHRNLGQGYPNKPMAAIFPPVNAPTILRKGCSVGAGSIVLCGVEIGEHAVINAGVLVSHDVPARTVVFSSRSKADFLVDERFVARYQARNSNQAAEEEQGSQG